MSYKSSPAPTSSKEKDIEIGQVLEPDSEKTDNKSLTTYISIWVIINVLATVAIVYINKRILSASSFSNCYFSFVSYHFTITGLILHIAGRPWVAIFKPIRTSLISILPLTILTCANVILTNIALAHSSILFYQVFRILLTPATAVLNLFVYDSKLPKIAALALLPTCAGVCLVAYSESLARSSNNPREPPTTRATSNLGIIFSIVGLLCSSLYTVWIAHYHSRLQLSSIQLLYNQVPLCALFLSPISLITDEFPDWRGITSHQWCLLLASGGCACMIHLSTFFIIDATGPVTSTVVAQIKSCMIVGLGWIEDSHKVGKESVFGIFLALSGITCYSLVMHRDRAR